MNAVTRDAPATLHVVDFAVGAVSPNPISVAQGLTSTATFQVTAAGSFGLPVTLNCSGLPAHAACSFLPASTVTPTTASPVTVTLTVSAATNTPQGTTTVSLQGATVAPAATRTAMFSLTVRAPPNFTWTGGGSRTVLAGQTTSAYSFTAATPTGTTFAGDVTFSCSGLPDSTAACVFNTGQTDPTRMAAGSGTTAVSLSITTTGPNRGTGSAAQQRADNRTPWLPLTVPLAGLLLARLAGRKVSRHSAFARGYVSLALIGLMLGCGGGGGGSSGGGPLPPPPPTVSLTVVPISVNLFANVVGNAWPTSATQMQFAAQVIGSTDQPVTWAVTGGSANGTIDTTGLYISPATAPNPPTATITATSSASQGQAVVSILTPTALGTFNVTVTATEGAAIARSQVVTLTVQ